MIVYGSPAQDVLQAAIDTIRTARSRESEARAAVEQHIKGCMALVKPECAAHLPRTEIERHISVGHAVAGYVCLQCSPAVACSLSRAISHPLAMRSLSVGVLALAYVQGLGASLPSSRSPRPGANDFPHRGSSGAVQSSRRLRQGCHHAACWRPHGLPTAGRHRCAVVSTLLTRRDDVVG